MATLNELKKRIRSTFSAHQAELDQLVEDCILHSLAHNCPRVLDHLDRAFLDARMFYLVKRFRRYALDWSNCEYVDNPDDDRGVIWSYSKEKAKNEEFRECAHEYWRDYKDGNGQKVLTPAQIHARAVSKALKAIESIDRLTAKEKAELIAKINAK